MQVNDLLAGVELQAEPSGFRSGDSVRVSRRLALFLAYFRAVLSVAARAFFPGPGFVNS
jgi:hypothetical protein